jgi:hypothetical protein
MRKIVSIIVTLSLLAIIVDVARTLFFGSGDPPNQAFKTLTEPPVKTIEDPHANGYLLLLGLSASAADPFKIGNELWLEINSNRGVSYLDYSKEGRAQVTVDPETATLLGLWDQPDALAQFQFKRDALSQAVAKQGTLLNRYQQWMTLHFEDWGYGTPGSPRFSDLFLIHRLSIADGFSRGTAPGIERLESDLAYWRYVLAQAMTPDVKIMASAVIDDDVALLSKLLTSPDRAAVTMARAMELTQPLHPSERSLRWPIQSAFATGIARYNLLAPGADDPRRKDSEERNRWLAALAGLDEQAFIRIAHPDPVNALAKSPVHRQRSLNLFASFYDATIRAADVPNSPYPSLKDIVRASHDSITDYLFSPMDNMFTSGAEPEWEPFAVRLEETDAKLRLANLLYRIRKVTREQDIPAKIAQAGPSFYDPFTGFPMLYNRKNGRIYSIGKDGRDDNGDGKLDIAMPLWPSEPSSDAAPTRPESPSLAP